MELSAVLVALHQAPPAFDLAYVWLALALATLAGLVATFSYLLLRRHRDWLGERLLALDRLLARRAPRLWNAIRRRFSRDAWHGLTLTLAALGLLLLIFLFAVITESWQSQGALFALDRAVNDFVRAAANDGFLQGVQRFTWLGGTELALPISLLVAAGLALKRWWWRLLAFVIASGLGTLLMWGLKMFFGRQRPEGLLSGPTSLAFPSGHSFTAIVLYGFLAYLVWRTTRHPALRFAATTLFGLLIVGVGLSRIVLSVHWVSDVLGGLTIGLAWLVFSVLFVRALQHLFSTRRSARSGRRLAVAAAENPDA